MTNETGSERPSRRALLWRHRWELLLVPGLSLALALTYEVAQLRRLTVSTEGVLYSYIMIGEGFAIIQATLLPGTWRQSQAATAAEGFRARWLLGGQWVLFSCITIYNTAATYFLVRHGARLHQADVGLATVAVLFAGYAQWRYGGGSDAVALRRARITRATGCKVAPQYIQAGYFAAAGSAGFSGVSLIAQVALSVLRLVMVWRTHVDGTPGLSGGGQLIRPWRLRTNMSLRPQPELSASRANLVLNWRDFYSILAMVAGWMLGRAWHG